jgi:hypothetical protein
VRRQPILEELELSLIEPGERAVENRDNYSKISLILFYPFQDETRFFWTKMLVCGVSHELVYTVFIPSKNSDGLFLEKPLFFKADDFKLPPAFLVFQYRMSKKVPDRAKS